jgi:NAD(P)H dehydrogenase (quinone)
VAKVLVRCHGIDGPIEAMAYAVAEGAREVPGADLVVKRAPSAQQLGTARFRGRRVTRIGAKLFG